jgi:hypothetical protein
MIKSKVSTVNQGDRARKKGEREEQDKEATTKDKQVITQQKCFISLEGGAPSLIAARLNPRAMLDACPRALAV